MADGWRRLLEEESEHQWLTLAMFTAFVVVGAFAINATENFVGDRIAQIDAMHEGGLVVDIEYHSNGESYTALVFSPSTGYELYTEHAGGRNAVVYTPETNDLGEQVNFLKTMPSGEVVFSVENNRLVALMGNSIITYDYTGFDETFTIHDVADFVSDEGTHRILLTQEGSRTSLRGVNNGVPTSAMSMSSGVQWHHVESHSEGLWVVIGTYTSASGADGSSPATPDPRPALGWVKWSGGNAAPVLESVSMHDSGMFHGFASTGDELIVGGTVKSLIIGDDESVSSIEAPSAHVVADEHGAVWFIGALGSTNLASYDGQLEVHKLSRSVPVVVSDAGVQGDVVQIHGTDEDGNPIQWSIDVTADGSIESGRGFLNLLFLLGGSILLAMMLQHALQQVRRAI
jgi:hypothetical protein